MFVVFKTVLVLVVLCLRSTLAHPHRTLPIRHGAIRLCYKDDFVLPFKSRLLPANKVKKQSLNILFLSPIEVMKSMEVKNYITLLLY